MLLSIFSRGRGTCSAFISKRITIPGITKKFGTLSDLDNTVIITRNCVQRIKQLQKKSLNENLYLRVAVEGGGCSGFQYIFKMEDTKLNEDDKKFSKDNIDVVIDSISYDLIKGATVDYSQEMIKSSFAIINNPQSESACGCGSSFAVKNFSVNPAID